MCLKGIKQSNSWLEARFNVISTSEFKYAECHYLHVDSWEWFSNAVIILSFFFFNFKFLCQVIVLNKEPEQQNGQQKVPKR